MNKLYLLPVSLLLLNLSFAQDTENSSASSAIKIITAEEIENLPLQKALFAQKLLAEADTGFIEIDPTEIEELHTEIAAIFHKKRSLLEEAVAESTNEHERLDERLTEKEPGSHIRRYATKPSEASKVQRQTTVPEFDRSLQKKPPSPLNRQSAKPSTAPKVQERVAQKPTSPRNRQSAKPSTTPKAQEKVAAKPTSPRNRQSAKPSTTPKAQEKVAAKPTSPRNRQSAKPSPAPKVQEGVAEFQIQQAVPKKQSSNKRRVVAPGEKTPNNTLPDPQKKQMPKKAMTVKQTDTAILNNSAERSKTGQLKQKYIAQNASQDQTNSQDETVFEDETDSQDQMFFQDQMDSKPQVGLNQHDQNRTHEMMYNKAVNPAIKEGANLWVMGEALLWQAVQENLTYVYTGNNIAGAPNRTLHTVDFAWDWGFRVGAGYTAKQDGWDLGFYWTNIRNTAHGIEHPSTGKIVFQVWTVAQKVFPGAVTTATSHWHVNLDQIDLELGREFYVGNFVTVRPFVGARSDWILQKFNVDLIGHMIPTNLEIEQLAKLRNRFWGFGFVAGFDTNWMLGSGFSLYGDADMSILMGFFDIDQKGTQNDVKIWNQAKSFRKGTAILDLGLGLKWSQLFCKDRFGIAFKLGYEYHLHFNQNQFIRSDGSILLELFSTIQGDLTYQGVIGGLEFDF